MVQLTTLITCLAPIALLPSVLAASGTVKVTASDSTIRSGVGGVTSQSFTFDDSKHEDSFNWVGTGSDLKNGWSQECSVSADVGFTGKVEFQIRNQPAGFVGPRDSGAHISCTCTTNCDGAPYVNSAQLGF
ncbi:uncharacterized protein L201_002752 [Kwoniella dendrophila CBS 6074]|uniref:Uncharacterized protein n=1 Tax=Kwoniella dendrophila CBS 6074 TaxID=1295534 RepID=A0AAX4JTH2_9TREE